MCLPVWSYGLFMIKFCLSIHLIDDILRFGIFLSMDALPFEQYSIRTNAAYRQLSTRRAPCMDGMALGQEQMQTNAFW